ncbi:atrial natriuretic peptide receptor 1-like isoform X2 [Paramacrobiotus metropolitanus]|uniref:atrial natriuretic peptide receptor 1-like isoform X2 n=1 Tax=Paramacrobiotus metropolitanus TaxID=2943436 RepID=UPI0024462898|nr:atrial natriuretic peptide receptor 1-like isoform X2 [Paramacrobiotus metropolitanus]
MRRLRCRPQDAFIWLLWTLSVWPVCPLNITLVTVHVGANPLYGYYQALPVFAVAVQHIQQLYPRSLAGMRYVPLYLPGYDLCGDGGDHITEFITDQYYDRQPEIFATRNRTNFPVLAHADCSTQSMPLGDLAREWDLPLFTSVAGDTRLVNKRRYSTTSAIASMAGSDVVTALHRLFQRYSWRTVTLICDDLSHLPGLSNFYVIQCPDTQRLLANEGYTWYFRRIDTARHQNFRDYLIQYKDHCRIFIILTLPEFLRKFLIVADDLRLTSGDYVFITLQPTTRPGITPITWKLSAMEEAELPNESDRDNQSLRLFQTYQNLIILTGVNPDWDDVGNLTDEISDMKAKLFGMLTVPGDERNELQICIYESTMMFAQIFDETYPSVLSMSKSKFIRKTFNRTFNFAARNFSTDHNGAMVNYIVVLRLDQVKETFSTAMIYDPVNQSFGHINPELWYWLNRRDPPPDEPPCGFANNTCDTPTGSAIIIGSVASVAALTMTAVVLAAAIRFVKRQSDLSSLWWLIDANGLTSPIQKLSAQTPAGYTALDEEIVGVRMQYRYQPVYAKKIIYGDDNTVGHQSQTKAPCVQRI